MVGAEVALAARARLASECDGACVACVAGGAVADCAVVVWFADGVALLATARHGRSAFKGDEWMRRAFYAAGLVGFGEGDLFGRECLFATNGGPGNGGVATVQKFLIDLFVASTTISSGDVACGHDEPVVVFTFLALCGLMTVEAVDAAFGVLAHFIFVNDGILGARMAVGALTAGAN